MKTGVHAFEAGIADVAACAAWAEEAGYDVVASAEVDHDPFLPLALAARDTSRVRLATTIAVAFARTPMTMAYVANDLQALSGGRFVLGLGTQTKPHITRRFGMPWGRTAARMREYITALRAIWDDWNTGRPVRHEGEHYRHTLMTATFRPAPHGHGNPPIHLAAVGPLMTRLAGEVADGLIPHGFSTERYFREVTLPALEEGLARAGRDRSEVTVHCPGFVHVHAPRRRRRRATADAARAGRLLRLHTGLPRRAGPARLAGAARAAARPVGHPPTRTAGTGWPTSSTTRCSTRSASAAPSRR
ncbi:TIGR03617 family F420-dependent LLM class oxidoreductase [Nonomuraea ferruginea]